jgi:predicted naringenin-chalcone synthase
MGCFGGISGLRTAQSIALADPSHRVLVVCTELCSLHVQADDMRHENLVAEAIFGDGAAAAVVGCGLRPGERELYQVLRASSWAIPNTDKCIQWNLSNTGYKVGLSPDIGFILGQNIFPYCELLLKDSKQLVNGEQQNLKGTEETLLQNQNENNFKPVECLWAMHPGGRAILDIIQDKLTLPSNLMELTRSIYQDFGNMSSSTVLFALERLSETNQVDNKPVLSLAFGPGLSIEGLLLKIVKKSESV